MFELVCLWISCLTIYNETESLSVDEIRVFMSLAKFIV